MPFDGSRKALLRVRIVVGRNHGGLRYFGIDHRRRDRFLRIERGKPAREIFKLAHIAGPAVMLESLKRGWLELFAGQSFALDLGEEVPDEIGYVFDAFTQRRQAQ